MYFFHLKKGGGSWSKTGERLYSKSNSYVQNFNIVTYNHNTLR